MYDLNKYVSTDTKIDENEKWTTWKQAEEGKSVETGGADQPGMYRWPGGRDSCTLRRGTPQLEKSKGGGTPGRTS